MPWLGRIVSTSITIVVALLSPACGDASFAPTSPSSTGGRGAQGATTGTVITGTVNGLASATTASSTDAVAAAAATMPVTVTVVGTNISTTIDRSGRFRLTDVPTGNVQLKFTGPGLDATVTLKGVQTGDRIDLRVRLTDSSVRIEAERRERGRRDEDADDDDGDDDDDEDDDGDDDDNELEGTVSGLTGTCPNITFTVRGVTVKANGTTRFDDGSCAGVRNNSRVEVHGQRQADGSIQAARIELED